MILRTRAVGLALLIAVVGCGSGERSDDGAVSEGALGAVEEKDGNDITVLQAWFGESVVHTGWWNPRGYKLIDMSRCGSNDCTAEAERAMQLPGSEKPSPMIGEFRYSGDRSGVCEVIEVRTIVKDGALSAPSFQGVGFYVAAYGPWNGSVKEIGKDRLHEVGKVKLKGGEPGTVLRFIMQGMCFGQGGNGGSIYSRNFQFKPFARFDADGKTHHVWDSVKDNYFLGRKDYPNRDWVQSFDRQNELLEL
jgi:hypothetical protein